MAKNVLLLAYYFPPATGIASERMVGFHRHLPAFGWDPLVLAPRDPHFHQVRPVEGLDPPSVIRTSSLELSRIFRKGHRALNPFPTTELSGEKMAPLQLSSSGEALREVIRDWVYLPDAQIGWVPFVHRAGSKALLEEDSAEWVVFSSSVPYSAHLAAARLASRFRVPWVAEFRDPWSAQDSARRPVSRLRRQIDERIEEWILRAANHVVVTAERTRGLLLESFPLVPREKVSLIPNGFDPVPPGVVPGPSEPLTLLHAGTLQEEAYLVPLLQAVSHVLQGAPGSLRIVSMGDPDPWRRALAALSLEGVEWLDTRGVVASDVAVAGMASASALLLFYPHSRFAKVISGKLFSYLGVRRPILGVVPPGSEMEAMIREAGDGRMVPAWDVPGIVARLEELLEEHKEGRLQEPRVSEEVVLPFSREARGKALASVLDRVVERRAES